LPVFSVDFKIPKGGTSFPESLCQPLSFWITK
jgi:hypothetical protein